MTHRINSLFALFWCAAFGSATAQPVSEAVLKAQGKRLGTSEILALHQGQTVYHENMANGAKVTIWYGENGMRAFKSGNRAFTGAWSVRDDSRCEETVAGPVVCMTAYQRGAETFLCDPREAPECRWRIRSTVKGDAENLAPKP